MKNNKGFAGIGIILAIIAVLAVGGVAYFMGKSSNNIQMPEINTQTNQPVENTATKDVTFTVPIDWKEYKNDELGISFMYPSNYQVSVEKDSDETSYATFSGTIKNKTSSFYFSNFDYYKDLSRSLSYKTIINPQALGIIFWRSNGSGPYECYDNQDCTPYSDEFQYGARFDLTTPENHKVFTFFNEIRFNDGKTTHSIEEAKTLPAHKDFFEIIKTIKVF